VAFRFQGKIIFDSAAGVQIAFGASPLARIGAPRSCAADMTINDGIHDQTTAKIRGGCDTQCGRQCRVADGLLFAFRTTDRADQTASGHRGSYQPLRRRLGLVRQKHGISAAQGLCLGRGRTFSCASHGKPCPALPLPRREFKGGACRFRRVLGCQPIRRYAQSCALSLGRCRGGAVPENPRYRRRGRGKKLHIGPSSRIHQFPDRRQTALVQVIGQFQAAGGRFLCIPRLAAACGGAISRRRRKTVDGLQRCR